MDLGREHGTNLHVNELLPLVACRLLFTALEGPKISIAEYIYKKRLAIPSSSCCQPIHAARAGWITRSEASVSYELDSYTIPALVIGWLLHGANWHPAKAVAAIVKTWRPFATQEIIYILIRKNFTRKQSNLCRTRKKFIDQYNRDLLLLRWFRSCICVSHPTWTVGSRPRLICVSCFVFCFVYFCFVLFCFVFVSCFCV